MSNGDLKWSDIAGPDTSSNGDLKWSDIAAVAPHPPVYDPQDRPISQAEFYKPRPPRQEPYVGMPLEQAWASDPISQGLASVLENPDVQTGLLAVGAQPELMGLSEAARGVETAAGASQAARTGSLPGRIAKLTEKPPETLAAEAAAKKGEAAADLEAAKGSGITIKGESFAPVVDKVRNEFDRLNYDKELSDHSRAKSVLGTFERFGKTDDKATAKLVAKYPDLIVPPTIPVTFQDIHKLRRRTAVALESKEADVRKMGMAAKDALDEYVGNLTEKDVVAPGNMSSQEAAATFKQGIEGYSRASAAQEISNIIERADIKSNVLTQSGKENALKREFKAVALSPYKMRLFSHFPGATQRITEMAKGGSATRKFLMHIGKAAPRGVVSTGFDFYLAHAVNSILHGALGPAAAPGIMAIGHFAHKAAGKMALAEAEDLGRVILHGEEGVAAAKAARQARLQTTLGGPSVFEKLMARPRTAQAIRNWANATGPNRKLATIALTTAIAKETNQPKLQQRIQQELEKIDQPNTTTVPEQMAGQ